MVLLSVDQFNMENNNICLVKKRRHLKILKRQKIVKESKKIHVLIACCHVPILSVIERYFMCSYFEIWIHLSKTII